MLEIFITVVAAVVVGGILLKFWRPILACTLTLGVLVISLVISIPLFILSLPVRIFMACVSDEKLEETMVRTYDEMLHEASSPEDLAKGRKTIKRIQVTLKQRKEKKNDKHVENMLEEAKWVL